MIRIRQPLMEFLSAKWWSDRRRPEPARSERFPFIALLCDSTSIEIFRPVGTYEAASKTFDRKNGIYALKKQVLVMAAQPHYALFTEPAVNGAVHDYVPFKRSFSNYTDYLKKNSAEMVMMPSDAEFSNWAVLADAAYIGPQTDTPGLRKVALQKPSQLRSTTSVLEHSELCVLRTPVERFFGRMKKLWSVARERYR